MRVFFGTNRNPNRKTKPTGFGDALNPATPAELRFGYADFDADLKDYKLTVADESLGRGRVGSAAIFDDIRKRMMEGDGRDALIYIHGFDFSFKEALQRTAAIAKFLDRADYVPMVFTWPGDGQKIPFRSYYSDRKDARLSAAALSRGFQKFAHYIKSLKRDERCEREVHVLAHSMGNWALSHAVSEIAEIGRGQIRRLWGEVILAAADEDETVFEDGRRFADLDSFCRRVTVYTNRKDLALVISDTTKFNPDRLGAVGPRRPMALSPKIDVVDCTGIIDWGEDRTGHQYYQTNPLVQRDLMAVLGGEESDLIGGRQFVPAERKYRLLPG